MITAMEAHRTALKNLASENSADIVKRFSKEIEEMINEAVSNGMFEVDWDCSKEIDLEEDAQDLVKIQVYLQSLGYKATIVVPRDDFEEDSFDYYYINISWEQAALIDGIVKSFDVPEMR